MTVIALEQRAVLQFAIARMATLGANETVWPAPLKQGAATLLIGAICCKKFRQAYTLLKLNLVFRHVVIPPVKVRRRDALK